MVGAQNAAKASPAIGSAVASQALDLGAPADVAPEWAETANLPDTLPGALDSRLSDMVDYASNLAGFDSPLDPIDQADQVCTSTANGAAEDGAQASYSAGGVDQWNLELDSPDPCQECQDAAAAGPYDVGDGPDLPIHSRCECESTPVTDDSEGRSLFKWPRDRRSMTEELWTDEEWRAAMSTADINDLPDSDFAYIEEGGKKDSEGKTTPRSLRHYPIHDAAHVRNALARAAAAIAGDNPEAAAIAKKAMPAIKAAAKKMGIGDDESKSLTRAAGDDCSRCDGEGTIKLDGNTLECPQCGGSGSGENNAPETQSASNTCSTCDGTGKIKEGHVKCPDCGGTGEMESKARADAVAMRAEMWNGPESRISPRSEFELREVPNGTGGTDLKFTGFASVTGDDAAYEMEDFLGPWMESVNVGAFKRTLDGGADVAFLLNHGGMTLARTKPGTLQPLRGDRGQQEPRLRRHRPPHRSQARPVQHVRPGHALGRRTRGPGRDVLRLPGHPSGMERGLHQTMDPRGQPQPGRRVLGQLRCQPEHRRLCVGTAEAR